MLTSIVPMAVALVMAASPADAPGDQGQPQQNPPQKETAKGAPETPKKRGGATEQVRRYMDEHAPKLADWLFESSSQSYEGEPLRNRGLRSLPPVAEHRSSGDLTIMRDLGVTIAAAEPKMVYVSSVMPSGIGSQVDIRPNDVIITLNGQPIESTQAFQARFNRLRQGSPIELGLRRGSQRLTVAFYKPSDRPTNRPLVPTDRPGPILPD
jgi:hypothetical protein